MDLTKQEALEEVLRVCRLLCHYRHTDEDFKIEIETLKTALHAYETIRRSEGRKSSDKTVARHKAAQGVSRQGQ